MCVYFCIHNNYIQNTHIFSEHINSVDINIKFTKEEMLDNKLPFLDCAIRVGEDRRIQVEVYRKPTHTDQHLLLDSHHPLEQKLGVIRTLQHRAECIPTFPEAREQENNHIKRALKKCGNPNWTFIKTHTKRKREVKKSEQRRHNLWKKHVVIPYVAGVSEKFRRVFSKHKIPVYFKPMTTLRQRLVHPKDRIPKHQRSNVVYAVECSEECEDLYIGETKQPLYRRMAQHRRANSSGQDSAVFLHYNKRNTIFTTMRWEFWIEKRGGLKEA